MALTGNITVARRGPARGDGFGYPIAPGEIIYTGSLFGVNAAGQAVRFQTSGMVEFVGIAQGGIDNRGSATPGGYVIAGNDIYALAVPAAVPANINAKVYATDDGTLTLTLPGSGYVGVVGYLAGIDNGQTYVKVQGR